MKKNREQTAELIPVWELGSQDKYLHRQIKIARTHMMKAAMDIRRYKQFDETNSREWMQHAAELEGSANLMNTWLDAIRSQKWEKKTSP